MSAVSSLSSVYSFFYMTSDTCVFPLPFSFLQLKTPSHPDASCFFLVDKDGSQKYDLKIIYKTVFGNVLK